MTPEISHQKSFEKALYSIEQNFPPGKLPGNPVYANLYVNTSQAEGDLQGPWNAGDGWKRLDDVEAHLPLDGGDGRATVALTQPDEKDLASFAQRTQSNRQANPKTARSSARAAGQSRKGRE
jgi:Mn-containing catalase